MDLKIDCYKVDWQDSQSIFSMRQILFQVVKKNSAKVALNYSGAREVCLNKL